MQSIADKIRHYRQVFRPPVFYALGSLALWLSTGLAVLIIGLLVADMYVRFSTGSHLLDRADQLWLFFYEIFMILGFFQVYIQGAERRYQLLHPGLPNIRFRAAHWVLDREKLLHLRKVFTHEGDLQALAKHLIEEWEWRRELKARGREPLIKRAEGFFRLPSAGSFAAYMTVLVAVVASIVISTLSKEVLFADLEQFLAQAGEMIVLLWLNLVLPLAACVLPGAVILTGIKQLGEALLERINDHYLGYTAFYRFISELLELHDRTEHLLLRKTRARVYWMVRLATTPLGKLPSVYRRIRRARSFVRRHV